MSRTLLVAGTASHVGKSTVAAGLCRLLADRGVSVAPFKAQNMSNNARVVARPSGGDGDEWGEIGVSQFVQARAARTTPTTDCNPVLLKPRGDGESQLVVQGTAHDHVPAGEYYEEYWEYAREAAAESYQRLSADHDVVVAEGAGSIAEINLHDRDLANVETADFTDAEIVLLVDIERGGAFASLYGTLELLPDSVRERVVGAIVTKFRGDPSLLEPGIEEIESRTGVPILGVLPYDDPGLPEEDSLSLPDEDERGVLGDDDGVPADRRLRIAVPRLPRISNATDLEALAAEPGVSVVFVPLEEDDPLAGVDADAVVVPGTKNTVDDLLALRESAFGDALASFPGPIVGICGGFQQLGERITNAALEGTGSDDVVEGLGLLPVETRFEREKRLERTTVPVDGAATPLFAGANGTASGYEIHAGRTRLLESATGVTRPLGETSVARGGIVGTYLHGLFDNENVREAFLERVAASASVDRPTKSESDEATPYDRAATLVREHVDLEVLGVDGAAYPDCSR
ncbi:cobyric acid synthase [Natronobacterium gregoryi]|uniref:Probable cobyric acid synthase n=2 Tax=Natronobacterium gregoryi TaxID=44930 RepID=L0AE09_NATGS|nr:cobyric acid synthase [Natronobacterium gregoryi]AFZ71387.1 cobyric acid synthase CobQ [Natronobacterium gregoryi SP2]ELY66912.1 cobyric acid synthase [Natronobacterium gregoryi SP2]PLK21234.1 cobyric acid synthase [Natronobacterium gregoryi SP2]SFI84844.1 adenosylcobyric acid synthase (glutamine-hydrolysing) [Natronobacterium gregoryi]